MACQSNNDKEFIMENRQKFGITENTLRDEYLNICAKNVRFIASRQIDEVIVLPSMSNFINSCTGLVDTASGLDTKFASLRVTHAHEELVDCETDNPGIKLTIKGQVIVRTRPCNPHCPPSYMAIPVEIASEVIYDFYSTSTGARVRCLKNELPLIEGSCMVINLNCKIYKEVCQGRSRYVAQVKGSVVDKLWKNENIWVEGIRSYPRSSITVMDTFDREFCSPIECDCDDNYAKMDAKPMVPECEHHHHMDCHMDCMDDIDDTEYSEI